MTTFTAVQVAAAYDALALHHDFTLGVTLTPGRVHVTTALLDEAGHPVVTGGVLQRVESSYLVEDTPAVETPTETLADDPAPEEVPA